MNTSGSDVALFECTPEEACKYKPYEKSGFPITSKEVYVWKYQKNPDGPARIFVAANEKQGLLGHCVYMPRKLYLDGKKFIMAYQGVDSYLDPGARGKAISGKLQTMAAEAINRPFYSFPNKVAEKIALKYGRKIYAPLAYDVFPLKLRSHPSPHLRFVPGMLLDCISYAYYLLKYGFTDSDVRLVEIERFKHTYLTATEKLNGTKTSDYLNWRYIENPSKKYTAFEFIQNEEVLGYIVSTVKEGKIEIYDFLCPQGKEKSCLKAFVKWCRKSDCSHIFVQSVGYNFHKYGFWPTQSRKNVITFNMQTLGVAFIFGDSDWD